MDSNWDKLVDAALEAQESVKTLVDALQAEERARYLYPSGLPKFVCGSDNDGYPSCMGDGSMCHYSRVLEEQVCKYVPEVGA